jgi:hypothetical protein
MIKPFPLFEAWFLYLYLPLCLTLSGEWRKEDEDPRMRLPVDKNLPQAKKLRAD